MSVNTFGGFEPPTRNYFPMPNHWINICAEINNLAELKVIQYVLRHTWGYKEYDGTPKPITTDEFMHGRKYTQGERKGERIDKGTGLSNRSVIDGLRRAVEDGYLICETDDSDLARVVKSYALKMMDSPDVKNPHTENSYEDSSHPCEESTHQSDVKDLHTPVKILHSRYVTSSQHPVNDLHSDCEEGSQRSEKETQKDTSRKTPEKDNNNPHALPQATDRSSSHQKKSDLLSSAPPEVRAIIAEWCACCGKSVRVNQTLLDHATTLAGHTLLPGELADIVQHMRDKDKKGWYAEHGLHLGNVVNEVEKHPPAREVPTPVPTEAQQRLTEATYETLEAEIRREYPMLFTMRYETENSLCLVIWYGPTDDDYLLCRDAVDWQYWREDRELIDQAVTYGQSVAQKQRVG